MEVNGREAGFQAYPSAYQRVRRRSRNSTPHIGSGPGGSHRVGPRRSPDGSSETNLKCNFQESLVPSSRGNLVTSGAGCGVLCPGRSGALGGIVRSGRRAAMSPRRSDMGSFVRSFRASFQGSFDGCFEHPSNRSADCCLPLGERRASPRGRLCASVTCWQIRMLGPLHSVSVDLGAVIG